MPKEQRKIIRRVISSQIERINSRIETINKWDRRISRYRLGVFLVGAIATYSALQMEGFGVTLSILILFIGLFIWLISRHQQLEKQKQRFTIWKKIRLSHLARMDLNWNEIPEKEAYHQPAGDHPYAADLNISGLHSLEHLIDTSIYEGGNRQLVDWLLENNPNPEQIANRQQLIQELKPMAYFRDQLQLRAAITRSYESEKDWNMPKLLKWLEFSRNESYAGVLILLGILALSNWILGILYLAGILKPYVIVTTVLYLVIYNFNSDKIKGVFDAALQIEKLLNRFKSLLIYLEEFPYKKDSKLRKFCAMYHRSDTSPSHFLRKIVRLAAAVSIQKNDILRALLNFLLPWDLFFAHKLNKYKLELKNPLKRWLDRFYELEALCSLANFAWLNPDYIFSAPHTERIQPVFKARQLGHPLIPHSQKVCNDITIQENGSLLLITGSNMSGKSTFLRTLGINLCLCLSGGPVDAKSFQTIPFRLFSSINITDSLDEGLSHFYAEVRKLRQLLNELNRKDAWPLFFLVDEIFRGTNNRERLIGSTAFLKHVAGKDGVGVISTHDLELAGLDKEIPELDNFHFEETIKNGKMSFEYQLKPGPCPTTNALTIMEMEGLPVENE